MNNFFSLSLCIRTNIYFLKHLFYLIFRIENGFNLKVFFDKIILKIGYFLDLTQKNKLLKCLGFFFLYKMLWNIIKNVDNILEILRFRQNEKIVLHVWILSAEFT